MAIKLDGWSRIRAGLYSKLIKRHLYVIEHVTPKEGFSYDEWHCGPVEDPHADQHPSLQDAIEAYRKGAQYG